jgi:hypothetical protein
MRTETGLLNIRAAKSALMVVALGSALSLSAWGDSARAADDTSGDQLSSAACMRSLPALEQAGYGSQNGHLQALKTLEACDIRLGLSDKADFANWLISQDLDHNHPNDD